MGETEIKEGDQVSWQWSGSRPGGKAVEVATEGKVSVESHRGNTISKNAEPDNPAVHIARSGNDVVKKASELDIEKEGDKHKGDAGEEKTAGKEKDEEKESTEQKEEKDDAQTGEKRKADDDDDEPEAEGANKKPKKNAPKQKKADAPKSKETNGDAEAAPKKKGRPAKSANGASKKKREPKKAATESGEPRRSRRNAGQ